MSFSPLPARALLLAALVPCLGGEGLARAAPQPAEGRAFGPRGPWERLVKRMICRSKSHFGLAPGTWTSPRIRTLTDVPYGPHPCQRADLYLPLGQGFPVVVFVHGGWMSEDKDLYGMVGRYLAEQGVGAVLVNYRLPPAASVDGEVRDAAKAFAWAHCHAAAFGGDPGRLFLCGQSAGGHLVAVLATNPRYLAAEGLGVDAVRGTVCISGTFRVGRNMNLLGIGYAFAGVDYAALSPARHVRPGLPPFLVVYCANERRYWRVHARRFHAELLAEGCRSELFVDPSPYHYGTVLLMEAPGAPLGPRIVQFIHEQAP